MKNLLMPINKTKMLISIVFSFRNEEEVLSELISRILKVIDSKVYDYEIIFINDDSDDASLEILQAHHKTNRRIKIVNMSRRFGSGPCVIAGFKHTKGDAVIYMDTDLQDPPELIPDLLKKWEDGFDIVHTTRTKRLGESALKMWLTRRAYSIINLTAEIDLPQNTGDFKLLSRRAIDAVLSLNESDPFIRGLSCWVGFKQTYVYYERQSRFSGETKYSLLRSSNPFKEFLRGITSYSVMPLYFSLFLGFFVSLSAFGYLAYVVISRIFFDLHLPGWPALMGTMLFLGGTILFSIGMLGVYVGKIFNQVRNRPEYIIESKTEFEEDKL
jgi:polyisoprenyl-phosphate glycosyltransferase